MKGSPAVINALQRAAAMEAALATQYHLDKRDARYMRLKAIAKKLCGFGEDCEEYLEEINDRTFALGGDPAYSAGQASTLPTITEIFQRALAAETTIVAEYNDMAILAMSEKDDNTRNKFEHWIKWHEDGHIDWLEGQLATIAGIGEEQYLTVAVSV